MDRKNVLLITVDSLRADRLSDGNSHLMPELNELADEGCRFTEAVSNGPNTTASFPSILTGAHSLTYGPYGILDVEASPFLAEQFRAANYETVGYHSNPYLGDEQNYHVGFDTYNDLAEGSESITTLKDRVERMVDPGSLLYCLLRRIWHTFSMATDTKAYARAETVVDGAVNWLDARHSDDPFFMWLHFMDVHYPFDPPEYVFSDLPFDRPSNERIVRLNGAMQERPGELSEKDVRTLERLYDGEVRYVDDQVGRLLDSLELDDTVVAFTADHGEAFGEHNSFGHHVYPYDELIRVPLIIAGGPVVDRRIDTQVQLLDLPPTLLTLVGLDCPRDVEGESFARPLTSEDEPVEERPAMFISENGETFGVRTAHWKYIRRPSADEELLFDLGSDPDERTDVSSDNRETVERFEELIDEYERSVNVETSELDRSDSTRDRLRDLGYLEE